MTAFDLDPDHPPTPEAIAPVAAWKQAGGRMMWWESRASPEVVRALPTGLLHVVVDPLEQPGDDGRYDYLAQARANLRRLGDARAALEATRPASP